MEGMTWAPWHKSIFSTVSAPKKQACGMLGAGSDRVCEFYTKV